MQFRRVVVTGMGALTPLGNTLPEYWNGLINGVSGAANITHFDPAKFKTKFACEVKGFDPLNFFDKKEARKLDKYSQFAMASSDEAIKDAGLNLETINHDRVGVIWATGVGGLKTFQDEVTEFVKGDGTPRFNPFFIPKMIADIASGHISMRYGFRGPNFSVTAACAASTASVIDAFNYIRLKKAEVFICGGSEASICEAGVGG